MIVGLVGKPNCGKSTFFKALTLAEAEIANFPFTTIKPNIGVGYVKSDCPCGFFKQACNPHNSYCSEGKRFTAIKVIDVAGLVPGAAEGKGLGNQFMDDLSQADALIHVVDISGRTNEKGEPSEGHDPEIDIKWLEEEIGLWYAGIIERNWKKISNKVKHDTKNFPRELAEQLSGLRITEEQVKNALKEIEVNDPSEFIGEKIKEFGSKLRKEGKPIIVAANKIDLDSKENYERLKEEYDLTPVCAEAELALREAGKHELIEYTSGENDFKVKGELGEKQAKALEFMKQNILVKYGSTGVQEVLDKIVFDILKQIVVYPVENENKVCDSKGNVLPDSYLVTEGSSTLDLAFKVHTDIGSKFIQAIDCKSKMRVGKDHVLKDGDVITIVSGR